MAIFNSYVSLPEGNQHRMIWKIAIPLPQVFFSGWSLASCAPHHEMVGKRARYKSWSTWQCSKIELLVVRFVIVHRNNIYIIYIYICTIIYVPFFGWKKSCAVAKENRTVWWEPHRQSYNKDTTIGVFERYHFGCSTLEERHFRDMPLKSYQ